MNLNRKKLLGVLLIAAGAMLIIILLLLIVQPEASVSDDIPIPLPHVEEAESSGAAAVVRQYFDRWNAKDTAGMDACRLEGDQGLYAYEDLPLEASVTLTAVNEQTPEAAQERFNAEWYPDPADVALVLVDYTVDYNEAGKETFLSNGYQNNGFPYWLVKETEEGPWRIATQGY